MAANKTDDAITCQVCGHSNLKGALMCSNCGAMLFGDLSRAAGTRNLADELPEFRTNPVFTASGSSKFTSDMTLRISVEDKNTNINVGVTSNRLLIGRRDTLSGHSPDVDMEDYEGYRLGVSRKHAQLLLDDANEELTIQDMGSANGTFLNGVRLPAHRPHKIQDGDEVRLGNLNLRFYFLDSK
jgi:hypothetical protein